MRKGRGQPWRILLSAWKTRRGEIVIYPVILEVPEDILAVRGSEKKAALSSFARRAARISATKSSLGIDRFEKDDNGVPLPFGDVFWSISHKPQVVAGVAASDRIGIDIEKIRSVSDRLFERIVQPEEMALFDADDKDMIFFRTFTAKEAVLKQSGVGIRGLSKIRIVDVPDKTTLVVNYANQKYFVENFYGDGYLASVTKKSCNIQWIVG